VERVEPMGKLALAHRLLSALATASGGQG
jgi:hypothetical protein